MRNFFLLFLAVCVFSSAFAQNDLVTSLESLKSQLVDVETKSSIFTQTLEWSKDKPFQVKLTIEETGKKKNKVKTAAYAFDLKDIDVNAVRSKTNKDIVEVKIFMKSKQKLVVVYQDGEFKGYDTVLKMYAGDADSGKSIEKIIKEAVEKAKAFPSSCPTTAGEGYKWMTAQIKDFSVGELAIEQSLTIKGTLIDYKVITKGKKTKEEQWNFNLADLNKRSVKLEIKNKDFYVSAKTKRNLKFIHLQKMDGKESYTNKINFFIADFEKAKCLLAVLELVIEDSQKKEKSNKPAFATSSLALETLVNQTGTVENQKYKITQALKPACATVYSLSESKGSGDAKEKEFKFNFLDVKAKNISIAVKGDQVLLNLGTGKNKLIQVLKEGEVSSYTNKVSFTATDVEGAKLMKYAAIDAAKKCKKEVGFIGYSSTKENFDWLAKSFREAVVPDHEQRLELVDGEACKWKIVSIKSGKKQLEEIFEFNLSDLNAKKVKWNISGKKLFIELNAKHNEKVIKYYKNGEPGNYKNSLSIEFMDIEAARNTIVAFEKAIASCKD